MAHAEPNDPVVIVEYDPSWPAAYEAAAIDIRAALGPRLLDIEHIGSTAVPGLPAKPVIDMQVGVSGLGATPEIIVALSPLGYEYVPELEADLPERRYF